MEHKEIREMLSWLWNRQPGDDEPIVIEDSAEPIVIAEFKKPELTPEVVRVSNYIENKKKEEEEAKLKIENELRLEAERIEAERLEQEKLNPPIVIPKCEIEELPMLEVVVPEPPKVVEKPKVIVPKNKNFSNGMTCSRNLR